MASWPATLPPLSQMNGYQRTPGQGTVRTEMSSGPAFQRRRFTSVPEYITGTLILTRAQRDTFRAFYQTTLAHGSLPFDEEDPVSGTLESMVFIADKPPAESGNGVIFQITVNIEVQP